MQTVSAAIVLVVCPLLKRISCFGIAQRKAKTEKIPNKAYYDDGSNVNLTCEAEKNTNLYKIEWYKFDSFGKPIIQKSERSRTGMLFLTMNSLSKENTGKYKCVISRPQVHYYSAQFVNITVKGTPFNFTSELFIALGFLFSFL